MRKGVFMEDRAIAGERHLRGARRVDAHTSTGPGLGPGAESSAGRIKELDGIRGLAVVAIVVTHATPDWLHLGWAAVDLFFGLSGFLITSIVLKHGGTPKFLRRFYVRRGLRTWPIYYLTILGLIVFRRYLPVHFDWSGLWYYLTYTQNVPIYWSGVNPRFHGFLAHTWSLAIEEQFYLLWPALVLLCGPRRVPLLATTCIMVSVVAGGSAGRRPSCSREWMAWRWELFSRRSSMARSSPSGGSPASWRASPPWGSSGSSRLGSPSESACRIEHCSTHALLAINLVGMGLIGVAVTRAGAPWLATLRCRPLTYLGEISYGLYLYHFVILLCSAAQLRLWAPWEMPPVRLLVTTLLCFLAAGLSWTLIERPILKLKDRFDYGSRTRMRLEPRNTLPGHVL